MKENIVVTAIEITVIVKILVKYLEKPLDCNEQSFWLHFSFYTTVWRCWWSPTINKWNHIIEVNKSKIGENTDVKSKYFN